MGGGAMIRGAARVMGATAAGAAAAMAPSASTAFCHASTPEHLSTMPSALTLSQKDALSRSVSAPSDKGVLFGEDLEYSSDEDWGKISHGRLVFAPVPSEEEVEEATKELHAALHLSIPALNAMGEESSTKAMAEQGPKQTDIATMDQEKAIVDRQLPSFSTGLGLVAAGSSSVYQAFHLLQTNSQVQDAVKSLARDPAIWKAVLSNEKVLELTQALREGHETVSVKTSTAALMEESVDSAIYNLTSKVCDYVTAKILQILDKVVDIVGSIFSSVEKAFFSKGPSSSVDKTVASCMMLAVTVLLVVLVKRAGK